MGKKVIFPIQSETSCPRGKGQLEDFATWFILLAASTFASGKKNTLWEKTEARGSLTEART
jgi:hypothetical protein